MKIDIEKIKSQVDSAALRHYGPNFTFRPNQKEAIVSIIYSWLTGTSKDIILEGPTGSGKSAIGMLVAAVLSEDYGKKGYIIISDLSLIQQYERDIDKYFKSSDWAVLKGQQNYYCDINGLLFSSGACKLKGCKTYKDIMSKFPECSNFCKYLKDRQAAISSNVLVCTYSFWLIQQNVVKKVVDNPPFGSRDFLICDEAHKLVGIVQNHFSPTFSEGDLIKMRAVVENASPDDVSVIDELSRIREIVTFKDNNDIILDALKKYVEKGKIVSDSVDIIRRSLSEKVDNGETLSKDDRSLAYSCDFIEEHFNSISEYTKIIDKVGVGSLVKNPSGNQIKFNCTDESYLMGKYFHVHCGLKLYMSATIGEPQAYAKDCAIKEYNSIKIPSTFDFTNSPIFYVDRYKLSYKEKDYSLPKIVDMISFVSRMYGNQRGIIQTGSYEFAKKLFEMAPSDLKDRLILYDDSKGKDEAIIIFKGKDNKILVGPSLVEGLSFDDDLCRFQIIMKVPYPSLADRFVKAKQTVNPEWYSNTTAISILQGVGRGIRNEKDWCVTFIFDGCFTYLWQKSMNMFPDEFKRRIQIIQPEQFGLN